MSTSLQDLIEQRDRLATQMRELAESEAWDKDKSDAEEKWQRMEADLAANEQKIERQKRLAEIDAGLEGLVEIHDTDAPIPAEIRGLKPNAKPDVKPEQVKRDGNSAYEDAFERAMRWGEDTLNPEQRSALHLGPQEFRAQSVGTANKGGYLVPEGFSNALERALLAFAGVETVSTVFTTATGNDLPWPTVNDTSNTGEDLAEAGALSDQDITFGEVIFRAWKIGSGVVKVSEELLQDSYFDLNTVIPQLLAERLGRRRANKLVNGLGPSASPTSASGPEGILLSTLGKTAASATTVTFPEVEDLIHSVDPMYRRMPSFRLCFSDSTLALLKNLRDESASNRPLWQPSVADSVPATIDGYRYVVDQAMPDVGDNSPNVSTKLIVAGDFSKFRIRNVAGFRLKRLTELYANNDQIGFQATMRFDSRILDAGTNPLKYLVTAAS